MKISLVKDKETKETIRFKEVPEKGKKMLIRQLYVLKWFAKDKEEVEVTVE